ncbi:MAG: hypothetical protein M3Z23_01310 [Acidobacteriota bacterium]|nr:hypothetical protein [Acidobacteriota bacterium]
MPISRRHFITGSALLAACGKPKAGRVAAYAFIASADDHSVSIIDLRRFQAIRKIAVGAPPAGVLAWPGSRRAFVLTPDNGTLLEIDTISLSIRRKLRTGGTPVQMRMQAGSIWLLRRDPHSLVQVRLDSFKIVSIVPLPAAPFDFDLSETAAAIGLPDRHGVALANLATSKIERVTDIGAAPRVIRFRPDGRQILTGNTSARTITAIDAQTGSILVNLPVTVQPERFCFKANGGELFVTGAGKDAVVIVNPYQTEVSETILAGRTPGSMAVSRGPEYLFVANTESGDITVIDIETRYVLAQVPVGQEPGTILITADSQYALVLNRKSGDVAVIRLSLIGNQRTNKALGSLAYSHGAPLFTLIPVGSKPIAAAIYAL